jgi:hypothetical protein
MDQPTDISMTWDIRTKGKYEKQLFLMHLCDGLMPPANYQFKDWHEADWCRKEKDFVCYRCGARPPKHMRQAAFVVDVKCYMRQGMNSEEQYGIFNASELEAYMKQYL